MTLGRLSLTKQHLFLILLLLLAAFLRFYNVNNNVMFLGDQGRDALVVSRIFKDKDPVFIGPMTSIGNMYLGPFYYYFMLPFLWLSYPSPMGPVYAVIVLSLLTVYLLYRIGKELFGQKTAWLATIFFALSANVIIYSRFSWNPNIAPFFSLLMFYFTYLAWQKSPRYWPLVALMFSVLIQLHYVTLLAAGGAGVVLLIQIVEKLRVKKKSVIFRQQCWPLLKNLLLALLIFLLSLLPLTLFDFKHDFLNSRAFLDIVAGEESFEVGRASQQQGWTAVTNFFTLDLKNRASQVLFESSFDVQTLNHPLLYVFLCACLLYGLRLWRRKKALPAAEIVLLSYLATGIIGVSLYQHNVYLHYIAYLLPMVYLAYGLFFAKLPKILFYAVWPIFLLYFLFSNYLRYPLAPAGWTLEDMKRTTEAIYQRVEATDRYNLVLLAETKDLYGMNYRYFLSTYPNEPVNIENHTQANKLFVINEELKEREVWQLPIYEIIVFPDKEVLESFKIAGGPEVTVLGRN